MHNKANRSYWTKAMIRQSFKRKRQRINLQAQIKKIMATLCTREDSNKENLKRSSENTKNNKNKMNSMLNAHLDQS